MAEKPAPFYADDATERISLLLKLRIPWLFLGLVLGSISVLFIGQFEKLLSEKIQLSFFLPLIVYMSDAVGTQTEAIYIRNLARKKIRLMTYLVKELILGLIMGTLFGILIALFAYIWLRSFEISFTVGLAMFGSVSIATIVALIIPNILYREKTDPALGAGPFATIIQDSITIVIYFLVASAIIFH